MRSLVFELLLLIIAFVVGVALVTWTRVLSQTNQQFSKETNVPTFEHIINQDDYVKTD